MTSITEELRRIIKNTAVMDEDTGSEWSVISKRMALSLADAIDAEHEESIDNLRELVRDVHALATDHGVDVRYPYCDAWEEKLVEVEKQMHELGVDA